MRLGVRLGARPGARLDVGLVVPVSVSVSVAQNLVCLPDVTMLDVRKIAVLDSFS